VSARILRYYLTAPYARIAPRSTAELVRGMDTAVMQVFNFTVNGLMYAVSGAIAVAAVILTLAIVAPLPTLAVLVYFGLAGLIYTRVVKPRAAHAGQEMTEASLAGWQTALAAIGGLKEIRLRRSHDYFLQRYLTAALRGAHSGRTAAFLAGLPRYVLEILFILAIGIVLILGSQQAGTGGALGVLALFVAAGFRILPSISQLLANISAISVGAEAVEIVRAEVRAARYSDRNADDREVPVTLERSIRLNDVHFAYPGSDEEVL
jgi:ABC-type transport system involved in cytochrome bd biosynthesis fused ATPase/permease subunit